jgi:hypothetical protein
MKLGGVAANFATLPQLLRALLRGRWRLACWIMGAVSQIVASDARTLGVGAAHHMAAFAHAIGSESSETGSTSRSGLFFDRWHGCRVFCVYCRTGA